MVHLHISETSLLVYLALQSIFIVAVVGLVIYATVKYVRNPFAYPYYRHEFDVSRKRNVHIADQIDAYLSDDENWKEIMAHRSLVDSWKCESEMVIEHEGLFANHRRSQYYKVLDDKNEL